ncbi:MAG TPA: hypothetical protein VFJ90_12160 [Candidatus Didemnitutus sp.]|nr:hypothetical protein [Candidatus Didemnitutus sp.]
MKLLRTLVAATAAMLVTAAAIAADPTGTWKWTQPGRQGGPGFEQTLKLELKAGQLTGTLLGAQTPMGQVPDVAIGDASFKDDAVAFTVTREFNGNKITTKYAGKLAGDTITGSTERPGRDGNVMKRDWTATRAK